MPRVHVCGICEFTYDETDRKPLMLLCGHTYCQQCLHNVVSGSSSACPSCRKEIVSPVNELPVNFIAIPSSSAEAASESVASPKMFCNTHQNELDYWCSQCKVLICKRCLVQTHAKHELTLADEIFADEKELPKMTDEINARLLQVKASIHTLQQVESLSCTVDELKGSIPMMKRSLLKQESSLTNFLKVLEEISSQPSLENKNLVLKMLEDQNQMKLEEDKINKGLKPFQDQIAQCQIYNLSNGSKDKPIEKYMPDGHHWNIISNELAEKALCTIKQTDHQTPKAMVISTDESPILCLPELLQYIAASNATMELQLMDKAVKCPYKKDWLPLKAEGEKSTDFKHCYRLKTLANSLVYFQTLTAALTAVDYVANDAAENKVIALLYPDTRTYDVCVLAFGKVVKSNTGSWPLPLEVHVIGLDFGHNLKWVNCILPSLYYIAQPGMGECRVYLPGYRCAGLIYPSELFSELAELGKKFSTKHRLFLPTKYNIPVYHEVAEEHKIAMEFKDF